MSMNDTGLLQRWTLHRDADAFAELVARHGGMVYGACRRVLGDTHEAEDAAQESFIELMRAGRPITASLPGWLHTVAVRRSLDRIKTSQRRRRREEAFAAKAGAVVEADTDDLLAMVDEAIAAQPDTYRIPIVLRFLEGHTHAEIGAQLGIAESTVRHRIEKGVEEVREALRKRGVLVGAGILTAALEGQSAQAAPAGLVAALGRMMVSGAVPAAAGVLGTGFWGLVTKAAAVFLVVGAAGAAVWVMNGPRGETGLQPAATADANAVQTGSGPESVAARGAVDTAGGPGAGASGAPTSGNGEVVPAVAVAGGEDVPPDISGRVYDAESGAGLADVKVTVWGGETGVPDKLSPTTDRDGNYAVRGLAPGRYQVSPRAGARYPGSEYGYGTAVTVEAGKPVALDFALKHGIRVAGRVVDTAGEPVAGASVLARTKESPNPGQTQSDAKGAFEVYLEAASEVLRVRAQTDTLVGEILEGLSLPSRGVDGITVTLTVPRTASVSGTVVDAQGQPMQDIGLHLHQPESPFHPPVDGELRTSSGGAFQISNLIPGTYAVGLTPPGVSMWSTGDVAAEFELTTGQQLRGLRIVYGEKGGLAISGIVVDTSGKPIPEVRVSAYGPKSETAHTGKDGRFLITGLDEGTYHLSTDHQDYTFGGKAGVTAGAADVEIVLQGKGSFRGRVTEAGSGQPIPAFKVSFINGAHDVFSPELLQNARTFQDASGAFEIQDIYSGPITVTVRANGYAAAFKAVTVVEHAIAEVDFVLKPGEAVTGNVLDPAGNPVPDAVVFLPGMNTSMLYLKQQALAQTDASGAFRIDGLPPGIGAIAAYAPPFGPAMVALTDYARPVTVTLPEPGVLEGKVIAPEQAVSRMMLLARYSDRPDFVYYQAQVEADGAFRLTGVAPGELDVQAVVGPTGRGARGAAVVASGQTTPVDLVFEDGTATVSGRVSVGGNAPDAAGAYLEVTTASGIQGHQAPVDAGGAYRFEGIAAGTAMLKVFVAPKENPVAAESHEITFDIAPGENVERDIAL